MLEGGDDVRRDQRPAVWLDAGDRIEADREGEVGRVEVDDVVGAPSRHAVGHRLGEITVRIEQREAVPSGEVGHHEIEEQRRLAGAGLADEIDVAAAIGVTEARGAAARCDAQLHKIARLEHRSPSEPV